MSTTFFNKLKWILGILLVFGLIAATNLVDRSNFRQLSDSVISIYEDRLVAKDIILDLHKYLQEKKLAVLTDDQAFLEQKNGAINHELEILIERYEGTSLTADEGFVLKDLKTNISALKRLEIPTLAKEPEKRNKVIELINQIEFNLDDLSSIQIIEGRRQVAIAKRAKASIDLFTQLEIYILIFLAIIIQVIILYIPKKDESD